LSRADLSDALKSDLDAAHQWVLESSLGQRCDFKPAGIALHWRGMPDADRRSLEQGARAAWEPICRASPHLSLRPFDGGLELRSKGMDKGRAVGAILNEVGENAAVAYLGDDETDEDAFRALAADQPDAQGAGKPIARLPVLVRSQLRPTAADVWLRPPHELAAFLEDCAGAAGQDMTS
jgi:trehalose-phosphatase